MAHQYKVGDKVRIIERKGDFDDYPGEFSEEMANLKGIVFTIEDMDLLVDDEEKDLPYYNGDDYLYYFENDPLEECWHSSMFEPVETELEFPQKIHPLRRKVSIGDFVGFCDCVGEIEKHEDLYFLILCYEQDRPFSHHELCMGIANKVPQWRDIARDLGAVHYQEITDFFPEFKTIEQLMDFVEAVNNAYQSKHITTPKTLNENEIKFQKPKVAFSRGSVPKGNPICGRKHKTAIVVGRLSNQEISC